MPFTNAYDLSIRIFPDGFSFLATEGDKVLLRAQQKNLDRPSVIPLLQQEMQGLQLTPTGKSTKLIIHTPVSTLVPLALYRQEDAQIWLRLFQTDIREYNIIYEDKLLPFNCMNVYALSAKLSDFLRACGEVEVRHSLSHLLLEKAMPFRQQGQTAVVLYVAPSKIDVAVLHAGQLMLANSYAYTASKDVLYHVLNLYERFHLPPDTVKCYVDISESGPGIKELLQQYVDVKVV